MIPFADIQAAAAGHSEAICRRWLPGGRRSGSWWLASVPWREDKSPSLGVHLESGKWKDFARGDHGDWVDMLQRLEPALSRVDAARRVAAMVGYPL